MTGASFQLVNYTTQYVRGNNGPEYQAAVSKYTRAN